MSQSSTEPRRINHPVILKPDGKIIEVTDGVFDALQDFMREKWNGTVTIQFRDGGIAGVEANPVKRYPVVKNGVHKNSL